MADTWFDIISRNTWDEVIIAVIYIGISIGIYVAYNVLIFKYLNSKYENKIANGITDALKNLLSFPLMIIVGIWLGTSVLILPDLLDDIIYWILLIVFSLYLLNSLFVLIESILEIMKEKSTQAHLVDFFEFTLRITISVLIGLWFLNAIGVDINAFLAGLGILGLGFAFALQNVIADLFASITIFVDRPFEIGDTIKIGNDIGTVEKIGLKSTQLRTPLGNQLIISNQELTNQRIHNMKRMNKRKVDLILGVSYETPVDQLEKIPNWIEEIINKYNDTEFGYAYLVEMAASSLNYKIVYHIKNSDAKKWLENQQSINLSILKKFTEENIDIPYPTQKIIS